MRVAIQREDRAGLMCVAWFIAAFVIYLAGIAYILISFLSQKNVTHTDVLVGAGVVKMHRLKIKPKLKQVFGTK